MKKEGIAVIVILLVIFSVSLTSFVIAQENEKIEKAYDCLEEKVEDKCDSLSVEEQAFTVLAAGKCKSELQDKSKDDECWPLAGCRLRDTSLAILALDRVGKDTEDAANWLLEQKKIPTDLLWYLEIDADGQTNCKITYDDTERTITIGEDKKINKGAGGCLSLAQDNYWLKIKDTCYETNFTVSCDKDFITTLLYKKKASSTIYVSSETESAPAEGSTKNRVNAFCFGTSCNYEGSLWATLALVKTDHDVSEFLPYLIAMEDENEKYFPSAFLYIITDYDEYFTKIINQQKNDYWKISSSPYHHYYDTALALLALYGLDAEPASSAKAYLLEVQGDNGCWRDNIRDTAFILYAAFPKSISVNGEIDYCDDYDYYCVSSLECDEANVLDEFYCYGGDICCKIKPEEKTCDEKGGIICEADQKCTGATVPAYDTSKCCLGSCEKIPEEQECEKQGYTCKYYCDEDEEAKEYGCGTGEVCCGYAPQKRSYWWIWLLVILIILVVLGIIFRNKLRMLIFKFRGRRGPAPAAVAARPRFPPPPPGAVPRARPRMIIPRRPAPARPGPIRRAISKTDKELEETLKKLKEMSK